MLGKRGRLVRRRCVSLPGETIRSSNGLLSRQCLASDSMRRPARSKSPRRLILRRARGRIAWRTSENIVLVGSENTCGVGSLPHQLLGQPVGAGLPAAERPNQRQRERPFKSQGIRGPKKDAGPKGPASQTGRLHVWETWDHEDPEFRTRKAKNRSCRKPVPKI